MRRRSRKTRYTNPRVLILCEGKTEKNYFNAILQDKEYQKQLSAVRVSVYSGKNPSPDLLVQEAIKRVKAAKKEGVPFKEIWIIFDHDNHPKRKQAWEEAIKMDFKIGFSAIAFEQWYLLHFIKSTRAYSNENELERALKKYYPNYEKARNNDFTFLKHKLEKAFPNAEWLRKQLGDEDLHITDQNPWTDVDILVKKLINATF